MIRKNLTLVVLGLMKMSLVVPKKWDGDLPRGFRIIKMPPVLNSEVQLFASVLV